MTELDTIVPSPEKSTDLAHQQLLAKYEHAVSRNGSKPLFTVVIPKAKYAPLKLSLDVLRQYLAPNPPIQQLISSLGVSSSYTALPLPDSFDMYGFGISGYLPSPLPKDNQNKKPSPVRVYGAPLPLPYHCQLAQNPDSGLAERITPSRKPTLDVLYRYLAPDSHLHQLISRLDVPATPLVSQPQQNNVDNSTQNPPPLTMPPLPAVPVAIQTSREHQAIPYTPSFKERVRTAGVYTAMMGVLVAPILGFFGLAAVSGHESYALPLKEKLAVEAPAHRQGYSRKPIGEDLEVQNTITITTTNPRLAGKGISSYIVAAHEFGLETLAAMDGRDKVEAVKRADIRNLSREKQRMARDDIVACIIKDQESGASVLTNHNVKNLRDERVNILPRNVQLTCNVSLETASVHERTPAQHLLIEKDKKIKDSAPEYNNQTGQLQPNNNQITNSTASLSTLVSDYVLGTGSVDVTMYSLSDRVTAAVEAYRVSGNRQSSVYKTIDQIASVFGLSGKTIVAESKQQNNYTRKAAETAAREERRATAKELYATQQYTGSQVELVKEMRKRYGISETTARADLHYVCGAHAYEQRIAKSIEDGIAQERKKSSHDVPEPVTLQMKKVA